MYTGVLLSVCQGREEARSSPREALGLAGRQGGLPGIPGQLSCGDLVYSL